MELIKTPLLDCYMIKADKFGDDRGFFLEAFNRKRLEDLGLQFEVQQINYAKSRKGVFRGLHYQLDPQAQAKLVGVIYGKVRDYVVDMRRESVTFGKTFSVEIDNPDTFLFIPRGFAHGYLTLSEEAIFHYAVDNFYSPEHERGIRFDDPALNLNIQSTNLIISEKDKNAPLFSEAELNF